MNVTTKYLTPNPYSRPQTIMKKVKGVVVHWFAAPKGSNMGVWNFWENRKLGSNGYGSAHECIDMQGDVLIALPHIEMSYGAGAKKYKSDAVKKLGSYPNNSTYHIECSHIDWTGKMTNETYNTLVERVVYWLKFFGLDPYEDLYLHNEITGKDCHKWFVDNPQEWNKFKDIVHSKMNPSHPEPKQQTVKIQSHKEECKVEPLLDWQKEMGEKALKELEAKGLISNADDWAKKLSEHTPNWLFFELFKRLAEAKGGK